MREWTLTEIVAAGSWFNGKQTLRKTATDLDISEERVEKITKSDEY